MPNLRAASGDIAEPVRLPTRRDRPSVRRRDAARIDKRIVRALGELRSTRAELSANAHEITVAWTSADELERSALATIHEATAEELASALAALGAIDRSEQVRALDRALKRQCQLERKLARKRAKVAYLRAEHPELVAQMGEFGDKEFLREHGTRGVSGVPVARSRSMVSRPTKKAVGS